MDHLEGGVDLEDTEALIIGAVVQDVNIEGLSAILTLLLVLVEVRVAVSCVRDGVGHQGRGGGEGQTRVMHCDCCLLLDLLQRRGKERLK